MPAPTFSVGKMVADVPGLRAAIGDPQSQAIRAVVEPLDLPAFRRPGHLRDTRFGHEFRVSPRHDGSPAVGRPKCKGDMEATS